MSGQRATVVVARDATTKTYFDPAAAAHEIAWYQALPEWAAPRLVDADPEVGRLVIATHPPADDDYRPAEALAELLRALEVGHVHHRDVHPGNVVQGPDGPLLIDWETAVLAARPSYDLHGPEVSGVPVPEIHAALRSRNSPDGYVMYWTSPHRHSIRERWGVDVPIPA